MTKIEQLAIEGHGAIQVDESTDKVPPIIFLGGSIKFWWQDGQWGTPLHNQFIQWRTAVEAACVLAGFAVYMPHKAIRGRWNEGLQRINDMGIGMCDVMIVTTPNGVPAEGTDKEVKLALRLNKTVIYAPPGTDEDLQNLIDRISKSL